MAKAKEHPGAPPPGITLPAIVAKMGLNLDEVRRKCRHVESLRRLFQTTGEGRYATPEELPAIEAAIREAVGGA